MEVAVEHQQWRSDEEEEVADEALQGRRSRWPAGGAIESDETLSSSKPASVVKVDELQNGNKGSESSVVKVGEEETAENNVYYDKDESTESKNECSVTENPAILDPASERGPGDDELVVSVKNFEGQNGHKTVINPQYNENSNDDSCSGLGLFASEKPSEEHDTNKYVSDTGAEFDDIELIKESDEEFTDFDVERVLENQNTHDLFCPNCHSCITRRVILRKRKRRTRILGEDVKRNKLETPPVSTNANATTDPDHIADISLDAPAANDNNRDKEPEIFRCLSCFSLFIPTGSGFKLFKIFGDKTDKENLQSSEQTSTVKKTWLSSMFSPSRKETLIEQGNGHDENIKENIVEASKQEFKLSQTFGAQGLGKSDAAHQKVGDDSVTSTQGPAVLGKVVTGEGETSDYAMKKVTEGTMLEHHKLDAISQLDSSSSVNGMLSNYGSSHPGRELAGKTSVHTEESIENAILQPQQDGLKILVHSNVESLTLEKSQMDQKVNVAIARITTDDKETVLPLPKPVSVHGEPDIVLSDLPYEKGQTVVSTFPGGLVVEDKNVKVQISGNAYSSVVSQSTIIGTKMDIHIEEASKTDGNDLSLFVKEALLLPERPVNITKDVNEMTAESKEGSDTIVIVTEGPAQPAATPETLGTLTSAENRPSALAVSDEARGFLGVEIIKSIVYGGLIESITSLGVVSSAAGADTTTLNILCLGLANLVGGLFFIGHNLWDLKNEESTASNEVTEGTSDQATTQTDQYQQLLGRRENFLLHMIVAMISFLIFGLLPPVIYGFSFLESDNKDYKLIAVAGASLVCIIILAAGKTSVQRPPKSYIKTVIYYVSMGFMASGISYAAGDLFKDLIEKLGWFDSNLALSLPGLEMTRTIEPEWASY